MKDYIKEIADILREGKEIIFYTVGSGTFENIRELKKRYGMLPTAICDGDMKKQGRTYKGLEKLTVISPQEAINNYPDGVFFITSLDYKYQIIGYLTEECAVKTERILNYVPVEKIRSCSFLQKALIYNQTGTMQFCWRDSSPSILPDKELNGKGLLKLRNQLIEEIRNGQMPSHSACAGCPQIREEFYPRQPRSWSVNYFCQSICNYRCSYCTVAHEKKPDFDAGRNTLGEVLSAYRQEDMLSDSYSVILSTAGEPLLHPKKKEFYEAFDGAELVINTNGSVYDLDLAELMDREKVLLLISIDAGTSETYEKVKGVGKSTFEKVKKNLSEYARRAVGIVALKYLFVPDVNDNPEDVDGFIQLCEETGAVFVVISMDYYSMDHVTKRMGDMVRRLNTGLSKQNVLCVPYTAGETAEYGKLMKDLMG